MGFHVARRLAGFMIETPKNEPRTLKTEYQENTSNFKL